jgi:hypothetical protein
VAGAVLLLLRLLRLPAPLAAGLALATLVAFAAVVCGQASVLRATLMAALVLVGQLLGREAGAWNSLAAALLLLLAWEPGALADPSLQLSFAARRSCGSARRSAGRSPPAGPARWRRRRRRPAPAVSPLMLLPGTALRSASRNLWSCRWPRPDHAGLVAAVAGAAEPPRTRLPVAWLLLIGLRLVVRGVAKCPAVIHAPPHPAALVAASRPCCSCPPRAAVGCCGHAAAHRAGTAAGYLPDGRLHVPSSTWVRRRDPGQADSAPCVDTGGGPGRPTGASGWCSCAATGRRWRLAALADPRSTPAACRLVDGMPIDVAWVPADGEADCRRRSPSGILRALGR